MREDFRLIQDGIPVAWASGTTAIDEITHYAAMYSEDGPVTIQKKISGRWKDVFPQEGEAITEAIRALSQESADA